MKCPMRRWNWVDKTGEVREELAQCEKEECAWWDTEVECCIVKSLRFDLDTIGEVLAGIKLKMPQEVKP